MHDADTSDEHGADWDSYWAGGERAGTFADGGPQDQALEDFWLDYFSALARADNDQVRVLDVGCGSGAVTGFALAAGRDQQQQFRLSCVDQSAAALSLVKQQYPDVQTLCSSAAELAVTDGSFDALVSQFGIEYAGVDAAGEAARVLRSGGQLRLIMHKTGAAIYQECAANTRALDTTLASGALDAFLSLLRCAADLRVGLGSPPAFEAADRALAPRVKVLEKLLKEQGKDICGGSIFRLYADIAHMYGKIYQFDLGEVEEWAAKVGGELQRFRGRLQSMLDAAVDADELDEWMNAFGAAGLQMDPPQTLSMGESGETAAWVLSGIRQGSA